MKFDLTFPGGLAVDANIAGFTIRTDQREMHGGGGTAPEPFNLFLASVATCMGFYAVRFCQQRDIDTTGLHMEMETERNPDTKMIGTIRVRTELPDGFPPKYVQAIERSMDQCAVKNHMFDPPTFVMDTEISTGISGPTS